jgi:hypothetical protein
MEKRSFSEKKMSIPRQKKERSFNDPGSGKKKSYFDFGWFIVVMIFEILVIATSKQLTMGDFPLVFTVAIITSLIISAIARHCYGDLSGDKI